MKKNTQINHKGSEYNEDGDRPVNLSSIPKINTYEELNEAMADEEMHFMHITDEKIYGINKLKLNKQQFLILEPNPVTFYFSLAFDAIYMIVNAKDRLEASLKLPAVHPEKAEAFSYFFRVGSVCVIFSFLAMEAFLNQTLPDNQLIAFRDKKVGKKKIEQRATFEEKLNTIIPKISQKNFGKKYPKKLERILLLKKLRNELTHLKEVSQGFTSYNQTYQQLLNADFKSIVFAVKSHINFYSPGLIVNRNMKTKIT